MIQRREEGLFPNVEGGGKTFHGAERLNNTLAGKHKEYRSPIGWNRPPIAVETRRSRRVIWLPCQSNFLAYYPYPREENR